jgi:ketosteroid isomerase-like protein
MSLRIRHCIECPKCLTRYVIGSSPYRNGAHLISHLICGAEDASSEDDRAAVATLDTQYQAAVEKNDAATMDHILAADFILVVGTGKTYRKADLLKEARAANVVYEHQSDTEQTVRVWGDTAVVTAKLWEKGTQDGKPFDKTLWFSDTYVRTPAGWRYVFGQASLALPAKP